MKPVFVDRHRSVMRALAAHGLSKNEAQHLIAHAMKTAQTDVRLDQGGRVLIVRKTGRGQVDVFEVVGTTQ